MSGIIKFSDVRDKVVQLRNQDVLLDFSVATILKSPQATQTTIAIIEAFAKLRELSRTIGEMSANPDRFKQKTLMQKSGEIMADLFGEDMQTTDTETEIELNFAVLKLKHTVKRKK